LENGKGKRGQLRKDADIVAQARKEWGDEKKRWAAMTPEQKQAETERRKVEELKKLEPVSAAS